MAKTSKRIIPQRGDVYVVNFDPTIGSEIKKTRPAVILQNNIGNRHSPVTIVAAISSRFDERLYPTEVFVDPPEGGLERKCVVLLNQVRTVDKRRLAEKIGTFGHETMARIDQALLISLGLVEL